MNLEKVCFKAKDENEVNFIVALLSLKYINDGAVIKEALPKYQFITVSTQEDGLTCEKGTITAFESECGPSIPSRTLATTADLVAFALRGFKEICEVAEEGYRIVTIQEREDNAYPTDCEVHWVGKKIPWHESHGPDCWIPEDPQQDCKAFAVPIDYKFKPATVKVVCEGKTVELSRESAKALNLI